MISFYLEGNLTQLRFGIIFSYLSKNHVLMKNLLFIFLLFSSYILIGQEDSSKTPKIAVKIQQGETVTLNGVSITFDSVLEDSRCPKYTNCIWAGRAIVQVSVIENGRSETKKIFLGETRGEEASSKSIFQKEGYFIEVVTLNPYPEDGKEKTAYTLLVCEGK